MHRSHAFTLVEMLIVIGVLGVLAGVLFLVAAPSKESARQTSCMSNLKQIYAAWSMYSSDSDAESLYPELHGLTYFTPTSGPYALDGYLKDRRPWFCPSAPELWKVGMATTYIGTIIYAPGPNGATPKERERMIEKERLLGDKLAILRCTVHDELYYAPQERDIDIWAAKPFRIELRVSGAVWRGRANGPREFVFSKGR